MKLGKEKINLLLTDIAGTTWSFRRFWACCRTMLRLSIVGRPREFEGNSVAGKLPLTDWFV